MRMAEFEGLTVRALRELARKLLGRGHSKLRTKSDLIAALSKARPEHASRSRKKRSIPSPKRAPALPRGQPASPGLERPSEPNPEDYLVARLAGKGVAHQAQTLLEEEKLLPYPVIPSPSFAEELGELPESYGEDRVVLLPKDPRSLYLFWEFAPATVRRASEWMPGLRTILRLTADDQIIRESEFSLQAGNWYFNDLPPGRTYRVELVSVASDGQVRRIGPASNWARLPAQGPSKAIEDRFVRIPFDMLTRRLADAMRGLTTRLGARFEPASPSGPASKPPQVLPPTAGPLSGAGLEARLVSPPTGGVFAGRMPEERAPEGRVPAVRAPSGGSWLRIAPPTFFTVEQREALYRASGGGTRRLGASDIRSGAAADADMTRDPSRKPPP
jgi:hypothetical protein